MVIFLQSLHPMITASFFEFILPHGYKQLIDTLTHSHGKILDLIFSNFDVNIQGVDLEAKLPDHFSITFSIHIDIENGERFSSDDK